MSLFKSLKSLVLIMTIGLLFGLQGAAFAQSNAKATVDAAKAQGIVGEQGDGTLGIRGDASAEVKAAVAEINAGRQEVYAQTAAKTGTAPLAAAQASAVLLFEKMPAGQYYKPLGGDWTRK